MFNQTPPANTESTSSPTTEAIPANFLDPISGEVMQYPHIAADGHSYEFESINKWLSLKEKQISPMTQEVLENSNLIENKNLRTQIQEYLARTNPALTTPAFKAQAVAKAQPKRSLYLSVRSDDEYSDFEPDNQSVGESVAISDTSNDYDSEEEERIRREEMRGFIVEDDDDNDSVDSESSFEEVDDPDEHEEVSTGATAGQQLFFRAINEIERKAKADARFRIQENRAKRLRPS
jgi:hypothetical protein